MIGNIFAMVGAAPRTEWLAGGADLERRRFLKTGFDGDGRVVDSPFAIAMPGVYAVGAVRSGSVWRRAERVNDFETAGFGI